MSGYETLKEMLAENIKRLNDESRRHKNIHRFSQTAIIFLTALTSIVAGSSLILPDQSSKAVQFTVLFLTSVSAAVTGWVEMRRAREIWQHEREIYYSLVDIQRELQFIVTYKKLTDEELEGYFKKIASTLSSSVQKWSQIQEKQIDIDKNSK
jgi:hypothetical protein